MGAVFGLFAAFYHWSGIFYGIYYSKFIGRLHFWTTFIGVNITFFPQHFLGLAGMPRRIPDYPDIYWSWNFISSIGAYISGIGLLIFFFLFILAILEYFKIFNIFWGYLLHVNGNSVIIKKAYNYSNLYNLIWLTNYKEENDYLWLVNGLVNSFFMNACIKVILQLFTNKFNIYR
jgi:heme/copper-type cytochrome/quinol oxidase subunit 1